MKVLVVGGGGREHALCWKIAQSPLVDRVLCAPGNGGTETVGENVDIASNDIPALLNFALETRVDLTVVGPEEPLCAGIADAFTDAGLKIFGPNRKAARIEGSKAFARDLCRRNRIPSPAFWVFESMAQANAFLENRPDGPIVVKASGLAAGKGVAVVDNHDEARAVLRECMEQGRFGEAGRIVVLEERLVGDELSVMALTDGRTIVPFEPARDHKAVFDGDLGPNTGGMGSVSPAPGLGSRVKRQVESQVLLPAVHGLTREETDYRGFLYAGLMLTDAGPRVLEFNCRLGDPETQPLLMRLESDLVPLLLHAIEGTLEQGEAPEWNPRPAVCVVAASGGYPGPYQKRLPIHGLGAVQTGPDLQVFHAGTARHGEDYFTTGGRVLGVCARGETVSEARSRAYDCLKSIEFRDMHYRTDIAAL